jgi:ABC-type multidrug transport system ATPase subunit
VVALLGASGAGKTTLLNTLSQRQKIGVVSGKILVDGRPLDTEFQRGTGFCEQMVNTPVPYPVSRAPSLTFPKVVSRSERPLEETKY